MGCMSHVLVIVCYNPSIVVQEQHSVVAPPGQPLIGIIREQDGREVAEYFTEDAPAGDASRQAVIADALSLAGAWRDLDWEEMITALERIRRESTPTPPIDLDP
jgi:hypothetical protein